MRIKNYIQFIKESRYSKRIYELSESKIREYLIELEDAGYFIEVSYGFVDNEGEYTRKAYSDKEVKPAYWIDIHSTRDSNNDDLIEVLKTACSIIEDEADAEIELKNSDNDELDIDRIIIKKGIFYREVFQHTSLLGYVAIFAKQNNFVTLTQKELAEYYGWSYKIEKDDKIYAEIDIENLADILISKDSSYKKSLVGGIEYMWDYYDISDYYPDINSLFQYDLTNENGELLIKAMIKEMGGLKNTIGHIGDECDDEVYDDVKDMSEEELIKYLLKERYKETIKQLGYNSDVYKEVGDTVANWSLSAHCDKNLEDINKAFDRIVEDQVGSFNKVTKEVTKSYKVSGVEREYKTEVVYYQFEFSNTWIEDNDSDDLYKNLELDDILREWLYNSIYRTELNPYFSDYGHVDTKSMNEDIKSYLTRYLTK